MIYVDFVFLWINPGTDLGVGEKRSELIFHQQPSRAKSRHRSEELDLYPDPSFAVDGRSAREIIHLLIVQSGGKNLAVGLAPDEHPAFEGDF